MDSFLRDLKHSLRMFAQSPAFTLAAVAALTLGIGANTAIFSVVNAVLLKPVAVPDPDRVVVFINTVAARTGRSGAPRRRSSRTTGSRPRSSRTSSAFNTGVMNYTGGTFPEQLQVGSCLGRLLQAGRRAAACSGAASPPTKTSRTGRASR